MPLGYSSSRGSFDDTHPVLPAVEAYVQHRLSFLCLLQDRLRCVLLKWRFWRELLIRRGRFAQTALLLLLLAVGC